ncbi:hypothetical protein [Thalassomonas actiniarum]|uniref:Uncharacterized protein n=1 Tax=Thalassomonas actiniarum TaxID=485447 RepID=A0AAE9YMS3_9GAMM|nr:hypothetical protein [Thalassomonas actiniarum]WDD98074.1 hypothetical protein SG35_022750 [Thalassomonas actiniarum]
MFLASLYRRLKKVLLLVVMGVTFISLQGNAVLDGQVWVEITEDTAPFTPKYCDYRWVVEDPSTGYNGSAFIPSVAANTWIGLTWSGSDTANVYAVDKSKAIINNQFEHMVRTFKKCFRKIPKA